MEQLPLIRHAIVIALPTSRRVFNQVSALRRELTQIPGADLGHLVRPLDGIIDEIPETFEGLLEWTRLASLEALLISVKNEVLERFEQEPIFFRRSLTIASGALEAVQILLRHKPAEKPLEPRDPHSLRVKEIEDPVQGSFAIFFEGLPEQWQDFAGALDRFISGYNFGTRNSGGPTILRLCEETEDEQ